MFLKLLSIYCYIYHDTQKTQPSLNGTQKGCNSAPDSFSSLIIRPNQCMRFLSWCLPPSWCFPPAFLFWAWTEKNIAHDKQQLDQCMQAHAVQFMMPIRTYSSCVHLYSLWMSHINHSWLSTKHARFLPVKNGSAHECKHLYWGIRKTKVALQEGCEYGCNSFITLPHGHKPVSSGKGINNYYEALCGKLTYLLPEDSLLMASCFTLPLGVKSLWAARTI